MHYLIDGHNLIAQMPNIDLDDPHDEAKLVLRLRSWAAAGRNRKVTVIFDGGLPGGRERFLSRGQVKVEFASTGRTADGLLIGRLTRVKNPTAWTLVSGDLEVIAAAAARRVPYITSSAFAIQLSADQAPPAEEKSEDNAETAENPVVTSDDVALWLELFGPEPEPGTLKESVARSKAELANSRGLGGQEDDPGADKPSAEPKQSKRSTSEASPAAFKSGERTVEDDELEEWLALFNRPKGKQ